MSLRNCLGQTVQVRPNFAGEKRTSSSFNHRLENGGSLPLPSPWTDRGVSVYGQDHELLLSFRLEGGEPRIDFRAEGAPEGPPELRQTGEALVLIACGRAAA